MSERINISLSQDFIDKLDKVCKFKNLKRSEWVRRKIDEELFSIELLLER